MNMKLLGAGAVAGALVLGACSSDDGEDTEASSSTETEAVESTEAMEEPGTIVEVASANEDFETLVAAVTSADLVDTLSGEGPFTVFAPTDEAFEALPEGLVDELLLEENQDTLTAILTYHVVSGEVTSDQISAGDVETVQGESVTVSTDDGVMVNEATVVAADVEASNGVIHVIDAVLVPPSVDVSALLE